MNRSRRRLLEATRIPRRYKGCTLRSFRPARGNASQLLAFNLAFRLVREYPAVDRGLLLAGPCGVGKTHLAQLGLEGVLYFPTLESFTAEAEDYPARNEGIRAAAVIDEVKARRVE